MAQNYGIPVPDAHAKVEHRRPARFLVVIDAGGVPVARLYTEPRELVAEFDAGAEEAAQLTREREPVHGADGPEWDRALGSHTSAERRAAAVYTIEV